MTLLNHLFGNKKNIAKELAMDDNKRLKLWDEHITNYELREKLSEKFNFANINQALENIAETNKILEQIESLISPELIHINEEEKNDEEILADLKKLKSIDDIEKISDNIVKMQQKSEDIIKLFLEIHDILKTELHLIKLIKKNPSKELLLQLFRMIFHNEAMLYKVFRGKKFREENKDIHKNIIKIARTIILEEEIKEEENNFAEEMTKQMNIEESNNRYRKFGEDIFFVLAAMAGAPMSKDADLLEGIYRMDALIKDDQVMHTVVQKLRSEYDDTKIKAAIEAFRKVYKLGKFIDLERELAT